MASDFPMSLDTFENPGSNDPTNSTTVPHAEQHAGANDAIEALEAKLGIGASTAAVATPGDVLTRRSDGTTRWVAPQGADVLLTIAASGADEELDVSAATIFDVTLTDDCTFAFVGAEAGVATSFTLILRQDAAGSRDPAFPAGVKWSGGIEPTLTSIPGAVSLLTFLSVDGGAHWLGFLAGDDMRQVSTPGAPTSVVATGGVTEADVDWLAPVETGGSAITGYVITPYISGVAQPTTTVGAVLTATITGLTAGEFYTFKVAAINDTGTGAQSIESNEVEVLAGFSPADVAGLVHWLDAEAITGVADGGAITTWEDSSASNLDATQATAGKRPTYDAVNPAFGNKPSVHFVSASAQCLDTAAPVATDVDDYTHVIVGNVTDNADADCFFYNGTPTGNGRGLYANTGSGGAFKIAVLHGGSAWVDSATTAGAAAAIYMFKRVAGVTTIWRNGVPILTGGAGGSGAAPTGVASVGSNAAGAAFHDGDVAEEIAYNVNVSTANLNALGEHLADKYGIAWTTI